MGKNLKGKSIGRGICQRKDGLYQAKVYMKGNPKPTYIYDSNLNSLRLKKASGIYEISKPFYHSINYDTR